jgi:hypothetical protein
MEYWIVGKKDIHPLAITPTLQYSSAPMPRKDTAKEYVL